MTEKTLDEWLADLDLNFWGTAQHKIMPAQFFERMQSGGEVVLLDTRSPEEADYLSLPFALHIPINELPARWQEVPDNQLVAIFCSSGVRSAIGYAYLQTKGLDNVRILDARYPELVAELKPGKALKLAQSKEQ